VSCDKASQATESELQECQYSMENDEDTNKKDQPNDCELKFVLLH